jgi:hypothetical protein
MVPRSSENASVGGCPVGEYMNGLHAGNNWVNCCKYPSFNAPMSRILDGKGEPPTQTTVSFLIDPWPWAGVCKTGNMHTCPPGHVMEGIHAGNNWFLCAR